MSEIEKNPIVAVEQRGTLTQKLTSMETLGRLPKFVFLSSSFERATHLKVDDDLAHGLAHEPRFGHVPDDGRRQAEQDHEKVRHGQVHDEDVRHGAHRVVRVDRDANQRVSDLRFFVGVGEEVEKHTRV